MNDKSLYFNPERETMSREQIEAFQLERLKETVRHCMSNEFYQKKFKEAGITPDDIQTLADVRKLPFTTKADLRDTYPFGMACVPLRDCVRLHSSSGTTGNPTVILHTKKDLDEWANQVARNLWMVGLRPDDVFQNSSGYGMFTDWASNTALRSWVCSPYLPLQVTPCDRLSSSRTLALQPSTLFPHMSPVSTR